MSQCDQGVRLATFGVNEIEPLVSWGGFASRPFIQEQESYDSFKVLYRADGFGRILDRFDSIFSLIRGQIANISRV
jgi:hypothetical protein